MINVEPWRWQADAYLQYDEHHHTSSVLRGFSTRQQGYSPTPYQSMNLGLHVGDDRETVIRNRQYLADMLDRPLNHWVFAEQVHGQHIQKVSKDDQGKGSYHMGTSVSSTDALYTKSRQTMLALAFADCVPLYFYAPSHDCVGIAHAGWKGTVANIGGKFISCWQKDEAIALDDIYVVIGPSICRSCYEVDDTIIGYIDRLLAYEDHQSYDSLTAHRYLLDLKALNRALLMNAGMRLDHIEVSTYCTHCQADMFYSHRRDNGCTGRMLGFIGLS